MIIDDEYYTFFLVHPTKVRTAIADEELVDYQEKVELGDFLPEHELQAHFNGGSLVWTQVGNKWMWA